MVCIAIVRFCLAIFFLCNGLMLILGYKYLGSYVLMTSSVFDSIQIHVHDKGFGQFVVFLGRLANRLKDSSFCIESNGRYVSGS